MNIIVIGGGTTGKFGNDFVLKARAEGHKVSILSHKLNNTQDPDQIVANFSNLESVVNGFNNAVKDFECIDIMLYNTNFGDYPNRSYNVSSCVDEAEYLKTFKSHMLYPYALALKAFDKMKEDSKIVFMTTNLSMNFTRDRYTDYIGYFGGKSFLTHLMLGLAHHNNLGIICSALSPHFDYSKQNVYQNILNTLYDFILNHTKAMNGKILGCWDEQGTLVDIQTPVISIPTKIY